MSRRPFSQSWVSFQTSFAAFDDGTSDDVGKILLIILMLMTVSGYFPHELHFLDDFSQQRCCINVEQTFDFRINCVGRIVSGCPNDPDVGAYLAAASRSSGSSRISTTRASSFAQR